MGKKPVNPGTGRMKGDEHSTQPGPGSLSCFPGPLPLLHNRSGLTVNLEPVEGASTLYGKPSKVAGCALLIYKEALHSPSVRFP